MLAGQTRTPVFVAATPDEESKQGAGDPNTAYAVGLKCEYQLNWVK
jgi:hypothetical protein